MFHVDFEICDALARCPVCGYCVHGLAEPRCPECGETFEWDDLHRPRFRCHPYLFEDTDEDRRPFLRFRSTYAAAHRPKRFWSAISRERPIRRTRMLQFYIVCTLIGLFLCSTVVAVQNTCNSYFAMRDLAARGFVPVPPWSGLITPPNTDQLVFIGVPIILWPILSCISILVFRGTLRRHDVRTLEVVRCVLYSLPCLCSMWFALLVGIAIVPTLQVSFSLYLAIIVLWCWCLRCGLRFYLRVDGAGLLVGFAHFILVLMPCSLWFAWRVHSW